MLGAGEAMGELNKHDSCTPGAHSVVRETDPEHKCKTFLPGEEDLEEHRKTGVERVSRRNAL